MRFAVLVPTKPPYFAIPLHDREGNVRAWTKVDIEDFKGDVAKFRWCLDGNGYATRLTGPKGKKRLLKLHREILGLGADDLRVDHINRDRLDNRRQNLRLGTQAQNQQNLTPWGKTSKYRGVSFSKAAGKWRADVCLNYKQHHLGLFETEEGADAAARAFRAQHMPFSEDAVPS